MKEGLGKYIQEQASAFRRTIELIIIEEFYLKTWGGTCDVMIIAGNGLSDVG